MQYLTIGTDEITEEKFRAIQDRKDSIKPTGGLWLTEYKNEKYNSWVNFLLEPKNENSNIYTYKYYKYYGYNVPCVLVSLKDDSNIFFLDKINKLKYLMENYKSDDNIFTFEGLSKKYDGIFIRPYEMIDKKVDWEISKKFFTFCVDTLLLFNLNCIDFYQKGNVDIVSFFPEDNLENPDYGCDSDEPRYTIKFKESKEKVLKR